MLTEKTLLEDAPENYMSDEQLAFFEARLKALREQVIENLQSFRGTIAENDIKPDPLDTACLEEIKQVTYLGVDRDTKLLHQIEDSLTRIRTHEYGFCMETHEPIGLKRLLANPNATLCIEAKEHLEQYGGDDPSETPHFGP
jgi:DnaK suppressor protein